MFKTHLTMVATFFPSLLLSPFYVAPKGRESILWGCPETQSRKIFSYTLPITYISLNSM